MEQPLSRSEQPAAIDLDTYLSSLPLPLEIDGRIFESEDHLFYHWVTTRFPQFQMIDGVTLEQLYEKNVLETGMSVERFFQYCDEHQFPVPIPTMRPQNEYYLIEFNTFRAEQARLKNEEYEMWAYQHGINTTPDAVMQFTDAEGNEYEVQTGSEQRGTILA